MDRGVDQISGLDESARSAAAEIKASGSSSREGRQDLGKALDP